MNISEEFKKRGYAPGDYFVTCKSCGQPFSGDKRASSCFSCAAEQIGNVPEAEASAERISSVVRSGADTEDPMLRVIHERDYLIEQLYKIYQHKDWLNMPDIVKEAVIFGLEKVSIRDGE